MEKQVPEPVMLRLLPLKVELLRVKGLVELVTVASSKLIEDEESEIRVQPLVFIILIAYEEVLLVKTVHNDELNTRISSKYTLLEELRVKGYLVFLIVTLDTVEYEDKVKRLLLEPVMVTESLA